MEEVKVTEEVAVQPAQETVQQPVQTAPAKKKYGYRYSWTDIAIPVAVGLCLVLSFLLPNYVQYMAACFAAVLCLQDKTKESVKSGIYRTLITLVGGVMGILVIVFDYFVGNDWALIPMIMLGLFLTIMFCKMLALPPIFPKIGGVTFVIVVMITRIPPYAATLWTRMQYAGLRVLGTVIGVVVATAVSWLFGLIAARLKKEK